MRRVIEWATGDTYILLLSAATIGLTLGVIFGGGFR